MTNADSAENATQGKDHTGLGPLRIPIFIGGTIFAYYEAFKSWGRVLANQPTEIFAKGNDTLIQSYAGFSPNLFQEVVFGTLMTIAVVVFSIGDVFMFAHYLGYPKEKKPSVLVEVGKSENPTAWATFYSPARIRIQGEPLGDVDVQQHYCRAIIGMDHEYLHFILYSLIGNDASHALDKLAPGLKEHCWWTGLNLSFEGSTRDFWEALDP